MRALVLPKNDWALVLAGGLLFALSYPPFHLILPSFTCLVPAVWLLVTSADDERPLRRRLVQGFWFGLATNGMVLYWIVVALWHFTPLAAAGYAATIVILGMYGAALFGVVGWIVPRTKLSLLIVLPIGWTALEWWIGHQGDVRFPWLGLGTSLTGYPILVQIADIVGARGVTFLLVLANTALALAWLRRRESRAIRPVIAVGAGVVAALGYGALRARTITPRPVGTIALVQPNVGFSERWVEEKQLENFRDLLALSQAAIDSSAPDLVIWPEAVVPSFYHRPRWEQAISAHVRAAATPILVGSTDYVPYETGSLDHWNAAFLFDRNGSRAGNPPYHKRYLVPIVERVPFVNPGWFDLPFFGGFSVGEPGVLYDAGLGPFGVLICYESAFEDMTRRYRAMGADFVVNITNDAWFGETSAPYQHFAHLVMRAIENRVGIARAGNSGISGFVDPLGRAYGLTPLNRRLHTADVLVTSDTVPLYTRLGDWVGLLSLVGTALLVGFASWRRS